MAHTYSRSIQNKITRLIDYNLTNDFPHDWDENIDELAKLANEFNRPFSAGLTILLTHASYKGDLDDVKEKINFVCSKMAVSGIPVGASRKKTLKNWFTGVSAPDVKARRQLYELCFALSVSLKDICWFFNNVLFQRAFNCHQIEEAIYYYCFKNNLDYLCKALKNRHFRGYGQPNLLPIYYFWGKSLDMRSTARASRPDGAAHR